VVRNSYIIFCTYFFAEVNLKSGFAFLLGVASTNTSGSFVCTAMFLWYDCRMDRLVFPGIQRNAFAVASVFDESDEKSYWLSKTPYERLEAVELMRQIIYGYDPSATRLQRVLEITQRSHQDLADIENLP